MIFFDILFRPKLHFKIVSNGSHKSWNVINPKGKHLMFTTTYPGDPKQVTHSINELIDSKYANFDGGNQTIFPVAFPSIEAAKQYIDYHRKYYGMLSPEEYLEWKLKNKTVKY